jgi:hippurate hydrolase
MKQRVSPLVNDTAMVKKINSALEKFVGSGKNLHGIPPTMGSEDFQHLVINNKKKVYDYILVGIANPKEVAKANAAGNMFPYYNHNANFKVDLSAIPFYTAFGAVALFDMFRK